MGGYRELQVTTGDWWAGLAGWCIKAAVLVGAITVLTRWPPTRRLIYAVCHWLWNFPLISMTVEGLRDLVRAEVEPLKDTAADLVVAVEDLRKENADQHSQVTSQISRLADTVEGHSGRLSAVEQALMNRWRRGEG